MAAMRIWIAGYGGPPAAAIGAIPVWIATGDGSIAGATEALIDAYGGPFGEATAVWIAGYGGPPPSSIGAIPIFIGGYAGAGGSVTPPVESSVWSAADASANGMTLSNGGLTVTGSGAGVWQSIRSSVNKTSGKLYIEFSTSATVAGNIVLGLASAGFNIADNLGDNPYSFGWQLPGGYSYGSAGFTAVNITNLYTGSPAANDVLALAIDFTAQQIWIAHNNVWGGSSNPATGTVPNFSFVLATTGALFAGLSFNGANSGVWTLQSTAASQKYAPPSGFSAWDGGTAPPPTSVWSASDASANAMTLSNGGLTVTFVTTPYQSIRGTRSQTSGKFYVEFLNTVKADGEVGFGLADASFLAADYLGKSGYSLGIYNTVDGNQASPSGDFTFPSGQLSNNLAQANDVWAMAVDLTAGKFWLSQNNVWFGGGNPATGASPYATFVAPALGQAYFPGLTAHTAGQSSGVWTLQSTAASQKYAPPAGFSAWDGGVAPPPSSVWSAADASANGMVLSNGGLTVTPSGVTGNQAIRGSISHNSGKLYVEFLNSETASNSAQMVGLADVTFNAANQYLGSNGISVGVQFAGAQYVSGGFASLVPQQFLATANDVIALAVDFGAGKAWIAVNNTWISSGSPATGATPFIAMAGAALGATLFPGMTYYGPGQGVWTLQSTAASQKYAPPAGFSAWDSAAPTHSPQALAYLARTVGGNEGGNGANIATLIDGLVSDGVWAKLDALYVLAQQNQTDALLNLIGTSYGLTLNALEKTPSAFTAYKGFNLAGSSGINTGFIPSSAPSPHFTLNSSSIGGWMYDAVNSNSLMVGTSNNQTGVYPTFSGGTYYAMSNAAYASVAAPNIAGWYAADGTATTVNAYFNGSSLASAAVAPVALDTVQVSMGTGATGNWVGTISAAFIGASLGAAGQLALYNRLRTYMTAIGVP